MEAFIQGSGNTIAGRDINIVLTPESAVLLAEALMQLQKKNGIPGCVVKNSKNAAPHFCLVACNDPEPTIQEGA